MKPLNLAGYKQNSFNFNRFQQDKIPLKLPLNIKAFENLRDWILSVSGCRFSVNHTLTRYPIAIKLGKNKHPINPFKTIVLTCYKY